MRVYGSPEYHEKIKRKYYSKLQKRTIVTAIEQGRISISEAKIAYKIRSEKIIRGWLSEYKSEKGEVCIEKIPPMAKKDKDSILIARISKPDSADL